MKINVKNIIFFLLLILVFVLGAMLLTDIGKKPETMRQYLNEWIYGTADEAAFFEKVGIRRLMELRADPYSGVSLRNRGYYDE